MFINEQNNSYMSWIIVTDNQECQSAYHLDWIRCISYQRDITKPLVVIVVHSLGTIINWHWNVKTVGLWLSKTQVYFLQKSINRYQLWIQVVRIIQEVLNLHSQENGFSESGIWSAWVRRFDPPVPVPPVPVPPPDPVLLLGVWNCN